MACVRIRVNPNWQQLDLLKILNIKYVFLIMFIIFIRRVENVTAFIGYIIDGFKEDLIKIAQARNTYFLYYIVWDPESSQISLKDFLTARENVFG